jgi:hypothetical protein
MIEFWRITLKFLISNEKIADYCKEGGKKNWFLAPLNINPPKEGGRGLRTGSSPKDDTCSFRAPQWRGQFWGENVLKGHLGGSQWREECLKYIVKRCAFAFWPMPTIIFHLRGATYVACWTHHPSSSSLCILDEKFLRQQRMRRAGGYLFLPRFFSLYDAIHGWMIGRMDGQVTWWKKLHEKRPQHPLLFVILVEAVEGYCEEHAQ